MAHTKVTKTHSQNTGVANTFSYSGSFDVFKGTEVQVELDNVALTYTASTINESASPREYTVDTSAKTVHVGGADLSSGTLILRPVTDMGAPTPRATYAPGSSITSADLNNNQTQLMRKAMEYDEQKLSSLGGTMTGHLTMGEDQTVIFEGATDDGYETTLTVTDPTADRTITLPNVTGTVVTTGDTGTVATGMIAADAITGAKIADNALDSEHYTDGSIDADHLSSSAVTTVKLGSDAVTGAKIADDAIDSEHYTDGSIDAAHIASNAVTTAKINADAVTGAKIVDDAIDSEHYTDGSIDTAHIADLQVTTAKIAADAITGAKIADDAIDSEHYTDGSIDTAHLAADAVTGAKIADDAIDSEHYTDASIDTAHITDANITAAKLASNAVTTAKITDANVTTDKLAADSVTIAKIGCEQTTISDSDSHVPTSGAVVDYVTAQIAPIGGLEVIADDESFPETQPASGVVISIADAGGLVVNGSGTSTTGDTITSNATVTINNINSQFNSTTIAAGVGMLVTSTGSGQIYNYHKATLKEADLINLSTDINDFGNRYRVNAGEPGSNNDDGDLVWDTNADKMKVYDATAGAWTEVTSTGEFKYLFLCPAGGTGAPTLDGSIATYDLRESSNSGSAASVTNAAQLIVSINGVVQKANTGTSAPAEGFALVDANTIIFGANLASGDSVFIIQIGSAVSIPTPGDGTVSAAKIASGAVTTAKIADSNVTLAKMAANSVDSDQYVDGSIDHVHLANDAVDGDNIADDAVNSEHYVDGSIDTAHIADLQVTTAKIAADAITAAKIADDVVNSEHIAAGAVDLEHMSSESVDEDNLHISNAGSNGQYLQKQSGNAGGLTWATATAQDTLSFRNMIINGAMQINQRGNKTGITSNSWGGPDRFEFRSSGDEEVTVNRSTESPDGFSYSYHVDVTTADAGLVSNEKSGFRYQIEGYDVQRLCKGTAAAKTSTLSFYVKTNKTGTYSVNLYDNTNTRHFSGTYTVSDTNWNRYSIAVPADTTGAFGVNGAGALEITWCLAAATSYTSGSAMSAWAAYAQSVYHAGHNVNFLDSTDNNFYITGIQYEVGSTMTDYEHRTYGDDLFRCFRYFQVFNQDKDNTYYTYGTGPSKNTNTLAIMLHLRSPMRTQPSLTVVGSTRGYNYEGYTAQSASGTIAISGNNSDNNTLEVSVETSGTGFNSARQCLWQNENDADAHVLIDAEI